jgi:DNA-binding FrmR family transcriptional regulator
MQKQRPTRSGRAYRFTCTTSTPNLFRQSRVGSYLVGQAERSQLRRASSRINLFLLASYTIGGYTTVKDKMHTVEQKPKLILRVRRIKGQIAAIERALDNDEDCSDLLQLITAARGAMNGLMAELLEGHIRFHVLDQKKNPTTEQALAADELIDVNRSYLR